MESQTSHKVIIDSESLQNLQEEIQQEFLKNLKKANFGRILEKYGISEKILKFQCIIDQSQIQDNSESFENPKIQNYTEKSLFQKPNKIVTVTFDWCPPEGLCSSP
ncbi:MAG: hypothetical protein V7K40_30860 [Nostoc sp.]|uniref:hypothetical protein n=1 Tax=Nostoc sp. TaxID=1180 RepID=UPI002FF9E607